MKSILLLAPKMDGPGGHPYNTCWPGAVDRSVEKNRWKVVTPSLLLLATIAMQACGVDYRNASSTIPVCSDADSISANYGTNIARALYFGFLVLDAQGYFSPNRLITRKEAIDTLDRVARFSGL